MNRASYTMNWTPTAGRFDESENIATDDSKHTATPATIGGYASDNWRDVMPETPIPPVADINVQEEFSAKEISKAEFEAVWDQANRSTTT